MTDALVSIFKPAPLVLASRKSALAMVQTRAVQSLLAPCNTEILGLSTKGDEVLDRPLVDVGGKGVFVKTLEAALLSGKADAAVHSMKDMETHIAEGTAIAAVLPREDRRDALVGPFGCLDALPQGAHIGTASVRRSACLHHYRPDLRISLLRGNVNSRLARLEAGEFDAIILAAAGLRRLGINKGYSLLDEEVMPAAAAQGALAVQVREGDARAAAAASLIRQLNCAQTQICVRAERAMLAELDGSCRTPISAMADLEADGNLRLRGAVLSLDGRECFRAEARASKNEAASLGLSLAKELLSACGGRGFLA
ncbi:MAG: Porphobilinogen deaminase [Rhodospirillaceae bacterium]|nr:MAG: Porphobilinogen deaminase [Rhodospirillaceae bacterium]